jgi:hypothetical protein
VPEQVWHRVVGAMRGDQLVAVERRPPVALAARNQNGRARFIAKSVVLRCRAAAIGARGSASTSAHHSSPVGFADATMIGGRPTHALAAWRPLDAIFQGGRHRGGGSWAKSSIGLLRRRRYRHILCGLESTWPLACVQHWRNCEEKQQFHDQPLFKDLPLLRLNFRQFRPCEI